MAAETNLKKLLKNMQPKLNKGAYVFVSVKSSDVIDRKDVLFEFKEAEGITLVLLRSKADEFKLNYDSIFSWITLEVHSSLNAVGLTAIFSNALAQNNVSCNVVAGYYHDHIFVNLEDAQKALSVLQRLSNYG